MIKTLVFILATIGTAGAQSLGESPGEPESRIDRVEREAQPRRFFNTNGRLDSLNHIRLGINYDRNGALLGDLWTHRSSGKTYYLMSRFFDGSVRGIPFVPPGYPGFLLSPSAGGDIGEQLTNNGRGDLTWEHGRGGILSVLSQSVGFSSTSVQQAITSIGSDRETLFIPAGVWTIAADITFPSTIGVQFEEGAVLDIATGKTVTFNGPVEAPASEIFRGDGLAVWNTGQPVYTEYWGAVGDSATDDSGAFQKALDSSPRMAAQVILLAKSYFLSSRIVVPHGGTILGTAGRKLATLVADPAYSDTVLVQLGPEDTGSLYLFGMRLENIFILVEGISNLNVIYSINANQHTTLRNIAISHVGDDGKGVYYQNTPVGVPENWEAFQSVEMSLDGDNAIGLDLHAGGHHSSNIPAGGGNAITIRGGAHLGATGQIGIRLNAIRGSHWSNVEFESIETGVMLANTGIVRGVVFSGVSADVTGAGSTIFKISNNFTTRGLVIQGVSAGASPASIINEATSYTQTGNVSLYVHGSTGQYDEAHDGDVRVRGRVRADSIGVGTDAPVQPLHVVGTIMSTGDSSRYVSRAPFSPNSGGAMMQGILDPDNSFARSWHGHNAFWKNDENVWRIESIGANDATGFFIPNGGGFSVIQVPSIGTGIRDLTHAEFIAASIYDLGNTGTITGYGDISVARSYKMQWTDVSATYDVLTTDNVLLCDGTFTVTLYTVANNAERNLRIKNSGTGVITVNGFDTDVIDDELEQKLYENEDIVVWTDGTEWYVQ